MKQLLAQLLSLWLCDLNRKHDIYKQSGLTENLEIINEKSCYIYMLSGLFVLLLVCLVLIHGLGLYHQNKAKTSTY